MYTNEVYDGERGRAAAVVRATAITTYQGEIRMAPVCSARVGVTTRAKPVKGRICATVSAIAAALLMASHLARADELDKVIAFDITATTLDKALLEFGAQVRLQIMFEWTSSTVGLPTRELKGSYTGKQALAEILYGTRLTYIERGHTLEILPQVLADSSSTTGARKSLEARPGIRVQVSNHTEPKNPDPPAISRDSLSGKSPRALSEVIVTAQKYSERAFDVPISLDVLTSRALDTLRITYVSSLQYEVPGLYVETGGGFNRITIDGVGNGGGSGALVGEYIDDADITGEGNTGSLGLGTGDTSLYDVSRVEVLHGPQGSLYGDGSMGGVIRVITNKPDLNSIQLGSDVALLFSQYGAPGQQVQTMLNMPLVAGTLGLRFAGTFEHDGGWVDEPEAGMKNVNSSNLSDVRFEGLWEPSAHLRIDATEIVRRDAYGIGYGEDAQGNIAAPLPFGLTTTPQGTQPFNLSNVTATYSISDVKVLSSSTYFTHDVTWANVFEKPDISASVTEYVLNRSQAYTDRNASEELRLSNSAAGPWQWLVGGFYKHYSDSEAQNAFIAYSASGASIINVSLDGFDTGSTSTAVFLNSSYEFTPRLEVGAGVRRYEAHGTYNEPEYNYHGYAGLGLVPAKFDEGDFASTDPRFYVRYGLTQDVNAYVTVAKGFREGGFNGLGLPNYQPEELWRYDAGVKSHDIDGDLAANLDLFYSDYSNYVVDGFFPALDAYYHVNAGTAHIKGVDADVKWRLGEAWRISVNGEYVDARFVSIDALDTGYTVGEQVPLVTRYSFAAAIERDFQWRDRQGYAVLSYSEISAIQDNTAGYIEQIATSDVMHLLNFNCDIDLFDKVSVGLFARNLLNDRGYLDPYWVYGEGSRQQPRTFGIAGRMTF